MIGPGGSGPAKKIKFNFSRRLLKKLTPEMSSLPISEWLRKAMWRTTRVNRESFADLPVALFWLRVLIGTITGVIAGALPLTGWSGFILFGVLFGLTILFVGPAYLDVGAYLSFA
jgi:hypothetical protein